MMNDEEKKAAGQEMPQQETETQESQKETAKQAEAPKQEANSAEAPKQEANSAEAPKQEEPKAPEKTPEEVIAELKDQLLRLRADFDNYRKRMAREANETRERAKIMVISDFLPVYDFFTMAMAHSDKTEDLNALKQGMNMIMNEFKRAFDSLGLKELKTEGEKFDPKFHEAARSLPSDEVPEGVIMQQWKAGYMVGERLVRPAMVVVSSGPEKPVDVTPEASQTASSEEPAEGKADGAEKEEQGAVSDSSEK